MVSVIDPTKPLDGVPAVKSDLRNNLQAAKDEIEALQNQSVLGQTGDVTITALAEQSSPASTAKVAVEQTDGSFRSVALSNLPVVSTGSGDGTVNVQSAPFNAAGDGVADDTAAIQAAIDATSNDGVVYLPPGNYSVNRLNVPHNRAIKFQGASPWATTLVGRTAGEDIFRITDPGGATVQDRFNRVHVYENLGFILNTGTGSPDLTTGLNRCTTAGLAVGPCCIAYVTDFVPSGTGNPGINAAWLHSFGVVSNCVANVSDKHGNHGCGFIHHGANHYGWTYQNIWLEGPHYGITDSLPWARRVTASFTSGRFTVANGTNPFQNGQTLFAAAHNATGSMPGGVNRFQVYHVINRDSSSFQLSTSSGGGAINLSSDGSGSIYVYGAADFAGRICARRGLDRSVDALFRSLPDLTYQYGKPAYRPCRQLRGDCSTSSLRGGEPEPEGAYRARCRCVLLGKSARGDHASRRGHRPYRRGFRLDRLSAGARRER